MRTNIIKENWKFLLSIPISTFFLIYFVSVLLENYCPDSICKCHDTIPTELFIITSFSILAVILTTSSLFLLKKTEDKIARNIELIGKIVKKNTSSNQKKLCVLDFLKPKERKVFTYIAKNGGASLQSEIVKYLGLSKLEVHRIISELIKKGLVKKNPMGKRNKIEIKKEVLKNIK